MTAPERGMSHVAANASKLSGRFRISSTKTDGMLTGEKCAKPYEIEEDSDSAQSTAADEHTPYTGEQHCLWRCPSSDSECDEAHPERKGTQEPESSCTGQQLCEAVGPLQNEGQSTSPRPMNRRFSHWVKSMEREDHWQPTKRECKNGDLAPSPGVVVILAAALTHAVALFGGSARSGAGRSGVCLPSTSAFTSRVPPKLSIVSYLSRLHTYFQCSEVCFLFSFIYIDRVLDAHPDFVISNLNLHRLVLTCVTVAAKFHDDVYYSNDYYSKVGGIPTCELKAQELQLLQLLQWRLMVTEEDYQRYSQVLRPGGGSE